MKSSSSRNRSAISSACRTLAQKITVKIFYGLGIAMKIIITVGLVASMIEALTGFKTIPGLAPISEGGMVCVNAAIVLSGAFPLMFVVSKILKKPMSFIGSKIGINATSAICLLPNLVTNATTFGMMEEMDKKGVVLNSALTVTVAFVFGSHLGFTMAYDEAYVFPMIISKLISGVVSVALVLLIYKDKSAKVKTK